MLLVCSYCRKLRPQHKETCVYVGAVRYYDAVGCKEPPPSPWTSIGEEENLESERVLASEDRSTYDKLKKMLPRQEEFKDVRILDVG